MSGLTPGQQKIKDWRYNPCQFVFENFGVTPDAWQADALNTWASPDPKLRLSLQACAGPGKTGSEAWMAWHFLSCFGDREDHPKAAAVAVTATNLADNLWPELSKWQSRSPFLSKAFTWSKSRVCANSHPETWFLSARSYSKTANAEEQGRTLSGLHSKYVAAFCDESGEIPVAVLKTAEQALSTDVKFGRIVQAGNPTSHGGMLYAAATQLRELWKIIRITGDPDDPKRSPRIDLEWAKLQIATYGRENPWVQAYILGVFPSSAINSLLSPDEIAAAMTRHIHETDYQHAQKRLGVDVARFGPDSTVIFPRQGLRAFNPVQMRGERNPAIAARVAFAKAKWGSEMEFVDDTGGFGGGVIDALIQAGHAPMGINFSGSASDPRYFNKRTEIHFLLAEWVKRGGQLPKNDTLAKELAAPTYFFQNGKLRLEEKDQIIKRLKFSPDHADALALTFSLPDMPAANTLPGGYGENRMLSNWEPGQESGPG